MNRLENILQKEFAIDIKFLNFLNDREDEIIDKYQSYDHTRTFNMYKVLNAFNKAKLSATDFYWTTGYGYGDIGRDKVEEIYSHIFKAEDSIVRPSIASGTHAINLVLSGILKQGDEFIEISGPPYDTLMDVIGLGEDVEGSLIDRGVEYKEVPLVNGKIDVENTLAQISPKTKLLAIQRSTGYSDRNAITIDDMEVAIGKIKEHYPNIIIFVDNCYGEFTEEREPLEIGADIIAGSLIKNPGGGIALSGGYICGNKDLIKLVAKRLTSPGLEKEVGLSFGTTRTTLQGLYFAPMVVNQAIKGANLLAQVYEYLGYKVVPGPADKRSDIIQAIEFKDPKALELFCQAIQKSSAVDSHVIPIASPMPGYNNDVIMASGSFIDGSSIEMSADGPMRYPYLAYYQGGLSLDQIKLGILNSLKYLEEGGYIQI